jgi:hypothetical protein
MTRTFHLQYDVGIYKATLKRNFYDNDRGPELDPVKVLIERPGQYYTLAELDLLKGFFCTAHDECVAENPEDYTALEVSVVRRKLATVDAALARLAALAEGEQV